MAVSIKSLRAGSAGPFQLLTLVLLIVIGLGAFIAGTYLQVFDDGSAEPHTTGANSFSRSAIGYRALVATLRKLDIPVEVSRFRTLDKVGDSTLLLVLAPDREDDGQAILSGLNGVPHALLVLPKWWGAMDLQKPIWIDRMGLANKADVEQVLQTALPNAKVERKSEKLAFAASQFGGKVAIDEPQYLVAGSGAADKMLETPDGVLLAKARDGINQLWILSDPDLLSNAGLDEADNGVVAISIIESMLPRGGTVIIDETAHGFEQRPNLLRLMLRPPFNTVAICGIAALLVIVWGGIARFGAPQAETHGLAAGKHTLIGNAAQLLRLGTTAANLLNGYRRVVLADAIQELHGPAGLDEFAQAAWLDRAAAQRGLRIRIKPIIDEIASLAEADRLDAARALRFSLDLYRWKQEILHGTVPTRRR